MEVPVMVAQGTALVSSTLDGAGRKACLAGLRELAEALWEASLPGAARSKGEKARGLKTKFLQRWTVDAIKLTAWLSQVADLRPAEMGELKVQLTTAAEQADHTIAAAAKRDAA